MPAIANGPVGAAALCLSLVLLVACASRGARFDVDKLPRIQEGVTTQAQIQEWFGPPLSAKRRPSGLTTYRYLHEDESVRDTGLFSRIGEFIATLFGYRGVRSPVNVRYKNVVRHELVLLFDPDGVVTTYGYERSETPSKQIY
jgi:outer membrane protein assembly factor BamE (lipoprotein component of BamABCDE complex)